MNDFRSLQQAHEELLRRQQSGADLTEQVQAYLGLVKAHSADIAGPRERDQLRSNLRYWASYVYEQTGSYPNVDLPPASQEAVAAVRRRGWLFLGTSAVVALAIAGYGLGSLRAHPSAPPTGISGATRTPPGTATMEATDVPAGATATMQATATPLLESTPIQQNAGSTISVAITGPGPGESVRPETIVRGTYANLFAGQSIHVFVRPGSKGGRIFPLRDFYEVKAPGSGDWSVAATLGSTDQLLQPETYELQAGLALNDEGRALISQAVASGWDPANVPSSILIFPETVQVSRAAYIAVDEERLVFSDYPPEAFDLELYSARLDGSDLQRLTFTGDVSEQFPSVSPDGKKIAYAGRQISATGKRQSYQLNILELEGPRVDVLEAEPGMIYEHPAWSADGKYIAYARGVPSETEPTTWTIQVYDLAAGTSSLLEDSKYAVRDFTWMRSGEVLFADRGRLTGTYDFFVVKPGQGGNESLFYAGKEDAALSTGSSSRNTEDTRPALSPDEHYLTYVVDGSLYIADLVAGQTVRVKDSPLVSSYPAWGSDSKTVYFSNQSSEGSSIWAVNADGMELRKILDSGTNPYIGLLHMYLEKP